MNMAAANQFEASRLANMRRNGALLDTLGVNQQAKLITNEAKAKKAAEPPKKRRRIERHDARPAPSRSSARIASAPSRPTDEEEIMSRVPSATRKPQLRVSKVRTSAKKAEEATPEDKTIPSLEELQASWTAWRPEAPPPIRDEAGVFHFESHPDFTPNRSPEEVIREGCFGGSYFRSLYSRKLGMTVSGDDKELPDAWTEGLEHELYLTSGTYDPDINKFKVACGQSIEEWELAGWINHAYDVRGWFQWYCRFYLGRRCADDGRQVSRWKKCVGATGRWRKMLLKKYVSAGVREVFDDGESEDQQEVSPVMHQTCHHWAFCVTQEVLDEYWRSLK
ncbi:hypothetical protein QTJ16_006511 [Diplocarpon rosae]|uniref:Vegetatible incompatibility protein HET-E-1 n=1 Tax=Diplocarpon rosae TaxID=946125 RepID=A0AAD9SUW1_9HELO|nr:hypothetical protein QTJ16_006511 [Diplocarpon rosae]